MPAAAVPARRFPFLPRRGGDVSVTGPGRPMDLAPFATHYGDSRGRLHPEESSPHRTPFQRDRDRIIHSVAFRRLEYKTQVFVNHEGDHYRTRLTHSLEVAQVARSVARALRLDEDLTEALALAHDLGHPPFGHTGEEALKGCMADYGGFDHNAQSLRVVTALERRYAGFDGLNLTWETLEGLVKHNGPLDPARLPRAVAAYACRHDLELASHAGLEAQVAAEADDIAYTAHDVDDGLRAGLFGMDDLQGLPLVGDVFGQMRSTYAGLEPGRIVHEAIRRVIGAQVDDLIGQTRLRLARARPASAAAVRALDHPLAGFSPAMAEANARLRVFLMRRMYRHPRVNRMRRKAHRLVEELFDLFLREPGLLPSEWRARCGQTGSTADAAVCVCDFIAGMTDRFAMKEHQRLCDLHPARG